MKTLKVNNTGEDLILDDWESEVFKDKIFTRSQRYIYTLVNYDKVTQKVKKETVSRLVMWCPKGMVVDHINGNVLDNRKENLRVCTQAENCRNRKVGKNNTSGYKGVYIHKATGKWRARIRKMGKHYSLGLFDKKEDAIKAHEEKAKELFGEFYCPQKV